MTKKTDPIPLIAAVSILITASACGAASTTSVEALSDRAAFEKLKSLAGEWRGKIDDPEKGPPIAVSYKTTSNNSIVVETLFVGTEHEMVTVYFLDKGKLVLVHYCAAGNQPRMKLAKASADSLEFEFAGGSNLKPAKDMHMHSAGLFWLPDGTLRSEWSSYDKGKPAGKHTFFLKRG